MKKLLPVIYSLLFLLSGCGGGSDSACSAGLGVLAGGSNGCSSSPVVNSQPIADAGPVLREVAGTTVKLNGSKSSDINNDPLTYKWVLSSKPLTSTAELSSSTSVIPTFYADLAGEYVATLVVNDGKVDSAAAKVTITASTGNAAPVAKIIVTPTVNLGTTVNLDGTKSTDANNDILTYKWTLQKPPTSLAVLSSSSDGKTTFKADVVGNYGIQLDVNDPNNGTATIRATVTAELSNAFPVANAGKDQNVSTKSKVTLTGIYSVEANGKELTYEWTLTTSPPGSTALLLKNRDVQPTFIADTSGVYVASLYVSNGINTSTPDTVVIVAATDNLPPTADAGVSQSVMAGSRVTLDGSKSFDLKDTLTYQWILFSKPPGSSAVLSSGTAVKPTFVADLAGTYAASLIVNDGSISSNLVTTAVTASLGNVAPIAAPGTNMIVANGDTVFLDGSRSSDANQDSLTYLWAFLAKPATSIATFSSNTSVKPTFKADVPGTFVVTLIVNDRLLDSTSVPVAVTSNAQPVANPGIGQTVKLGVLVKLDGSKSTDLNNDNLTYKWQLLSKPLNSISVLSSITDSMPTFTPDKGGDYSITLTVNDGIIDSAVSVVKITVTPN